MDAAAARVSAPNDVTAVRRYTQRYRYDVHGNILELRHQLAARHSAEAWTRRSQYSAHGNRLRASAVGRTETPERFEHDAFGRMQMPHLDAMVWDELDQLRSVRRGTTEVFFQYVGGQRVRKWTVKGGRTEERVYVGGVEEFRAFVGDDPFDEDKVDEQTHTEHAPGGLTLDVKLRRDRKAVAKPKPLYRYRLGNHLGSTSLEVDEDGGVVSYEEYHPYGTTAYRAVRSGIDVDVSRYRFTGMEKDEETGLAHHGWRYFASWLGRWCSADPIGLGDGLNRYAYCGGDPVGYRDAEGSVRITAAYRSIVKGADLTVGMMKRLARARHMRKTLREDGYVVGGRSIINLKYKGQRVTVDMLRDAAKKSGKKFSDSTKKAMVRVKRTFKDLEVPYDKDGIVQFEKATANGMDARRAGIVQKYVDIGEFVESEADILKGWALIKERMVKEFGEKKGMRLFEELKGSYTLHHDVVDGKLVPVHKDVHDLYKHTGGDSFRKHGLMAAAAAAVPGFVAMFLPRTVYALGADVEEPLFLSPGRAGDHGLGRGILMIGAALFSDVAYGAVDTAVDVKGIVEELGNEVGDIRDENGMTFREAVWRFPYWLGGGYF